MSMAEVSCANETLDRDVSDGEIYSLAEQVLSAAREKSLKIACAESCTGGMVAAALTSVPGSSDVFVGGIVSYSNAVKVSQLGVSEKDLREVGAVSREVACGMAQGVRSRLCADLAVSTTGIAGPGGASEGKPVGTVWMATDGPSGTQPLLTFSLGSRAKVRRKSTYIALSLLKDRICKA